jgi:cellulase/cellobiase CelA1
MFAESRPYPEPDRGPGHSSEPRSLSPQARVLVLAGVIAGAVVTSFLLAATFVSLGQPPVSEDATRAAAATPSTTPRTPTPTPSRTPSRTPSITPMVTPTLTETPAAPQNGPVVQYFPSSQWEDGFVGVFTITNTGSEPLEWEISFELRGDAEIQAAWQAEIDQDDEDVTARGVDYNAVIEPGGRTEFGFRAVGDDEGEVGDCTINGEPCQEDND